MSNHLSTFAFAPGLTLRAVLRDGEPGFVAMDISTALGTSTKDVRANLDSDEVFELALTGQRGRPALMVTESGLYALILKSRKPEAKAFRKWVTSVVLPAIRKDGAYVMGEEEEVAGEMNDDVMVSFTALNDLGARDCQRQPIKLLPEKEELRGQFLERSLQVPKIVRMQPRLAVRVSGIS